MRSLNLSFVLLAVFGYTYADTTISNTYSSFGINQAITDASADANEFYSVYLIASLQNLCSFDYNVFVSLTAAQYNYQVTMLRFNLGAAPITASVDLAKAVADFQSFSSQLNSSCANLTSALAPTADIYQDCVEDTVLVTLETTFSDFATALSTSLDNCGDANVKNTLRTSLAAFNKAAGTTIVNQSNACISGAKTQYADNLKTANATIAENPSCE